MNEPSALAVFGTLFGVLGLIVGIVAMAARGGEKGSGEPEPEGGRGRKGPELLELSEPTRAALTALDFRPLGGQFWECGATEPGTEESVSYSIPNVEDRMHEIWINPDDLEARAFLLSQLELRVMRRGDDVSDLAESFLLPEETVPGAVVELVRRIDVDGQRRSDAATPDDVERCRQFLDGGLVAKLAAIPRAELEVKLPTPNEYEIWVRWPEVDERSGTYAGDALALLRAVAAKLR